MNKEIIQTRDIQDAMKGWKKHSAENEHPSTADEVDVEADKDVIISASNGKKKNKDPLFHEKKKVMTDREIFDSFFLSDQPWQELNDD